MALLREELSREASSIIRDFTSSNENQQDSHKNNYTISDLVHDRLERFRGVLELYVHHQVEPNYSHDDNNDNPKNLNSAATNDITIANLDCLTLIEALCRGWRTNNTNTNATNAVTSGDNNSLLLTTEKEGTLLQHATHVCQTMLEQTAQAVRDTNQLATEIEDTYHVQLEAHSIAAK